jgi:phosphoglycerate kinase
MQKSMRQKLSITELALQGKRLFIRVDFNVPLNAERTVIDDTRMRAALPTIRYAREHGAKVILASHLGRPDGKPDPQYSLQPVAKHLAALLHTEICMAEDCIGERAQQQIAAMQPGDILLLENLRFHKEETTNDPAFSQALAALADLYVNDAFGAAHRAHASIVGMTHYLPQAAAGFLLRQEIEYLGKVLYHPEKPFTMILGGAKVSDKIGIIENLLSQINTLLIGGGMAYTFLRAQGFAVGNSLVEMDKQDKAAQILQEATKRGVSLLLPRDHVVAQKIEPAAAYRIVGQGEIPKGWMGLDIGPATVKAFSEAIHASKMIFWNGPMGVFEVEPFHTGTVALGRAVAASGAVTVVGGGDTVAAVHKAGIAEQISHISTGGGASLEFLEGQELPGIATLTDHKG